MNVIIEIIGIAGGLFILIAFFYASTGRWNGKTFWYEFNNFVGSLLLFFYTYQKDAYTNIVLNLLWAVVACYALMKMVTRRRKKVMGKVVR